MRTWSSCITWMRVFMAHSTTSCWETPSLPHQCTRLVGFNWRESTLFWSDVCESSTGWIKEGGQVVMSFWGNGRQIRSEYYIDPWMCSGLFIKLFFHNCFHLVLISAENEIVLLLDSQKNVCTNKKVFLKNIWIHVIIFFFFVFITWIFQHIHYLYFKQLLWMASVI